MSTLKQYAAPVYDPKSFIDHHQYSNIQLTISDCLFYETLLMMLRGESVKFSKQQAKKKRIEEEELRKQITKAQKRFDESKSESDLESLELIKSQLETLRQPMIEGLIMRSRVSWYEHGEKNSKYFLSLEKRNGQSKSIQYIKEGDRIITQTKNILSVFSKKLEDKYRKESNNNIDEEMITNNITNTLTPNEVEILDAEITLEELTIALHTMKKGKTPGSNGFPAEFFRTFWAEIGPFLHRAFIASLTQDQCLPSHREGIIKMIPKHGRSPHTMKGWRPITLLNVDYKIVSTAIANRFKSVIDKLISPSQTAYICGRYIGENTRLLFDIIALVKEKKMEALILAADFEAAFESVSWDYLRSVLKNVKFGNNFLKMIDLL